MYKFEMEAYNLFAEHETLKEVYVINSLPNECPICKHRITAQPIISYANNEDMKAVILCPNEGCDNLFISRYEWNDEERMFIFITSDPKVFNEAKFDDNLEKLSSDFVRIYNQAKQVEDMTLNDIAGVGYRKALEFLIKDYCISENQTEKEKIEQQPLMQCIKEFIDSPDIRDCAERATWLGNDETHYVRKWIDKDIEDLKNLIQLTGYWISMKLLTNHYKGSMGIGKR